MASTKFRRLSRKLAKRRGVRDPDAMARAIRKQRPRKPAGESARA